MRRFAILALTGLFMMLAAPAFGSHVNDGGVDEPWVNDMNQASYWNARFGGTCTKYENHSGFIPASYEAAVIKDGNMVRVYNPAPDDAVALGAVNPANGQHFSASHSWVMKCDITTTTTTTPSSSTTTTTPDDSTTTTSSVPEESTTTMSTTTSSSLATTTTAPGSPLTATWDAYSECDVLVVPPWDEGIVQVNVFLQDPQFGEMEVDPFLSPGSKNASTGEGATWILVPVVVNGYTAVPDQIELTTSRCDAPSTSVSPSSVPPSTLPFTGPFENVTALAASAVGLIVLGWMVLKEARR